MTRPDYTRALHTIFEFAKRRLHKKERIRILDLCGGTGFISHELSKFLSVQEVTIVDINDQLLDRAKQLAWKDVAVKLIASDVLDVHLKSGYYDLILSIFAYHHIPDAQKLLFLRKAITGLASDGSFIMAEIYSPNQRETNAYYASLLASIPSERTSPELINFIQQTASNQTMEFKVSKKFAEEQCKNTGLLLVEERRVWPEGMPPDPDVGAFVQVFRARRNGTT